MLLTPNVFPLYRAGTTTFHHSKPTHCPRYFQFKLNNITNDVIPAGLENIRENIHLAAADLYAGAVLPRHTLSIKAGLPVSVVFPEYKNSILYIKEAHPDEGDTHSSPRRGGHTLGKKRGVFISKYDLLYAGILSYKAGRGVHLHYYQTGNTGSSWYLDSTTINADTNGSIYKEDIFTGFSVNDVILAIDEVVSLGDVLTPTPTCGGVCPKCPYLDKCYNIHKLNITSISEVVKYGDRI